MAIQAPHRMAIVVDGETHMRINAESARADEYRCEERPCPAAAVVRAALDAYFDLPIEKRDRYLMPHGHGN